MGFFSPATANYGRERVIRTPEVEEEILERVAEDPKLSTRNLGFEVGVSNNVVNRVLKEQQLYPYHIQSVQELLPVDSDLPLGFCRFINEQRTQNVNFVRNILFTDEAYFTRRGVINLHNEYVYADENPHAIGSFGQTSNYTIYLIFVKHS